MPPARSRPFRRHAFATVYELLRNAERGRGLVVLGPRRVGKTVLLHQVVEQLLADGVHPDQILLVSMDDVALRDADLGTLLELVDRRRPLEDDTTRYLLLDEVQHAAQWSGWLKRIADRRDPYVFLATGSSATALRRGGQDSGLGRWHELVLYPWSFREHVELRGTRCWTFDFWDTVHQWLDDGEDPTKVFERAYRERGEPPESEAAALENALVDYLVRGGFPEVADKTDLREAHRHLRHDILDRALGRDLLDVTGADSRALERMFLRICRHPGGLWNTSEVAKDLQISRPTVQRYLALLEQAFLVFPFPNLASPVRGQPKVYLVAPSLRAALYGLDEDAVRRPEEWGPLVENLVCSTLVGTRFDAVQLGFWRRQRREVDAIAIEPRWAEYIEVKRSGRAALGLLRRAADHLKTPGWAWILQRAIPDRTEVTRADPPLQGVLTVSVAEWLYRQRAWHGGTLRVLDA